jgi:hypothetical protein
MKREWGEGGASSLHARKGQGEGEMVWGMTSRVGTHFLLSGERAKGAGVR